MSPSTRKTLLTLALGVLAFAGIFCGFGLGWLAELHLGPRPRELTRGVPPPEPETADLGLALIPDSTPRSRARNYDWSVESLVPARHRVGYGLGEALTAQLEREHVAYGERMGFKMLGPDRFTYQAPPGCREDMRCIYAELMRTNAGPVNALGERFVTHIRARQLDTAQAADLILGFVQRIHYELPQGAPFGIVPPALVPALDQGDCDSKAVLAVMLLRQAGIDATVLYSDPLSHAAVGVGLPGSGTALRLGGRTYRYAEVSSEGWPVGMIPPRYDQPRMWRVLPPPDTQDKGVGGGGAG
ncbi:hypothetical protein P2318_27635 [Myxococcaceae bacterium GXIMD 01537]